MGGVKVSEVLEGLLGEVGIFRCRTCTFYVGVTFNRLSHHGLVLPSRAECTVAY